MEPPIVYLWGEDLRQITLISSLIARPQQSGWYSPQDPPLEPHIHLSPFHLASQLFSNSYTWEK